MFGAKSAFSLKLQRALAVRAAIESALGSPIVVSFGAILQLPRSMNPFPLSDNCQIHD
jgi:hypothetical protein